MGKALMKKYVFSATLFLAVLFFTLSFSAFCRTIPDSNLIRVRVGSGRDMVLLSIKGPYKIKAANSDLVLDTGRRLREAHVTPVESGIKIAGRKFKVYGIRIIPKIDGTLYVDKKRFAGAVDIIRTEDLKLLLVNRVDIEKYLYGVLSREVPHYWPMEMLKAQAIAARTFALYRKELAKGKDYDVTSDIYSQVYDGILHEKRPTTKAVRMTKGRLLTYKGKIFPAYYHSLCAGYTESAKALFDTDLPPLSGKKCLYCKGGRNMSWKAIFSYKQIEERLNKYGILSKGMDYIVEGKRNRSGRLETVKIRDKKGVKTVKGYKFRLALGPNTIKSANFTIAITRKGVLFRGRGWGHGVGMCQWGAFGMAKKRFTYKQILEYYYPDAKISSKL